MRAWTMAAALVALAAALHAEDVYFCDGRVWLGVRVIQRDPTYLIVMKEKAVFTIRAVDLSPEGAAKLGLREPTREELAARAAEQERHRQFVAEQKAKADQAEAEANERLAKMQAEDRARKASQPAAPLRVINEPCHIMPISPGFPVSEYRLFGSVLARLENGAIVIGNRGTSVPTTSRGNVGWVVGTIYVPETSQLIATYRDAPVSGMVAPAGEYRYTDSSGTVHVLSAWRLQ